MSEKGTAVKLVFLLDALEEDLQDPFRLIIALIRQQAHLSQLDNDFSRELNKAAASVFKQDLVGTVQAVFALFMVRFIFDGVFNVESRVLEQLPQFELSSTHLLCALFK